jgi:hypothetical protein
MMLTPGNLKHPPHRYHFLHNSSNWDTKDQKHNFMMSATNSSDYLLVFRKPMSNKRDSAVSRWDSRPSRREIRPPTMTNCLDRWQVVPVHHVMHVELNLERILETSQLNHSTSLRSPSMQLFVGRVQLIAAAAIVIDSSCKQLDLLNRWLWKPDKPIWSAQWMNQYIRIWSSVFRGEPTAFYGRRIHSWLRYGQNQHTDAHKMKMKCRPNLIKIPIRWMKAATECDIQDESIRCRSEAREIEWLMVWWTLKHHRRLVATSIICLLSWQHPFWNHTVVQCHFAVE